MNKKSVAFLIHDFNPWGGQDKSTMEIARELSASGEWNVQLHAFTYIDSKEEFCDFQRVVPNIRRPVLFKSLWYYVVTGLKFMRKKESVLHATGACSLVSDVIQVQFVHARWADVQRSLPSMYLENKKSGIKSYIARRYHHVLDRFNLFCERLIFKKNKTYIAISKNVADDLNKYFGISNQVSCHSPWRG